MNIAPVTYFSTYFSPRNENHIVTATSAGASASYAYDPLGRRQTKTVGATITNFLDDGDDEIAEYDSSGNVLRRYVPGPGINQPIAMVTGSGATLAHQYIRANHQGSVIDSTDDAGTRVEGPIRYDPFGNCVPASQCNGGTPYRFTGMRLDAESGLYYDRARYYSSPLGRFLQTDPIGYKDDLDLYTYVGNDPTDKTDPSGQIVLSLGGSGEAYYIGGVGGGLGVYYDTDTGQIGTYESFEAGTGIALSGGGSFGVSKSMRTFQGWQTQLRTGAGPVTGQANTPHLGQSLTGGSINAGVGIPFDFTISKSHTSAQCWFFCGDGKSNGQTPHPKSHGSQPAPNKGTPVSELPSIPSIIGSASASTVGSGRSPLFGQTVGVQGSRICSASSGTTSSCPSTQ